VKPHDVVISSFARLLRRSCRLLVMTDWQYKKTLHFEEFFCICRFGTSSQKIFPKTATPIVQIEPFFGVGEGSQ
jgi:hypothetical protein